MGFNAQELLGVLTGGCAKAGVDLGTDKNHPGDGNYNPVTDALEAFRNGFLNVGDEYVEIPVYESNFYPWLKDADLIDDEVFIGRLISMFEYLLQNLGNTYQAI